MVPLGVDKRSILSDRVRGCLHSPSDFCLFGISCFGNRRVCCREDGKGCRRNSDETCMISHWLSSFHLPSFQVFREQEPTFVTGAPDVR
jgi:hypothetical protein